MLSDRHRTWMVPLLVSSLVAIGAQWSWLHVTGRIGYDALHLRSDAFDGKEVVLSLVRVAEQVDEGHYRVEKGTLALRVVGSTSGLPVGADVSIGGIWRADPGWLEQRWVDVKHHREGKKRLGIAGLIFLAAMARVWFRLGRRGLELRG